MPFTGLLRKLQQSLYLYANFFLATHAYTCARRHIMRALRGVRFSTHAHACARNANGQNYKRVSRYDVCIMASKAAKMYCWSRKGRLFNSADRRLACIVMP